MMAEDWRVAELRAERDGLRHRIAGQEATISQLERLRAVADSAFAAHSELLHAIGNEQCSLRQTVAERGTISGPDGRPLNGPTPREQGRYDELTAERGVELERYRRWRDERQIEVSNEPISRDWSTRDPQACARKIAEQRRVLAMLGQRLGQVEGELAELEAAAAAPVTAPTPHGLVERLRQKIG